MPNGSFKPSDLELTPPAFEDSQPLVYAPISDPSAEQPRSSPSIWLQFFIWFSAGMVVCGILVLGLLTFSSTHAWLSSLGDTPVLTQVRNYFVSTNEKPEAIRVADQLDPLRLEKIVVNADDIQIANFFSKKYRIASSEVRRFIAYTHTAAKAKSVDPMLLLAVMSIESNLNPIMESPVGAQGLMQVMTAVHTDKLAAFGGDAAVFVPESNIMVGATILADCIKLGGSIEMGLKCYSGASGPSDYGYGAKVLAEKERIEKAKLGVFDFTSNNKVLVDLGILAPNPVAVEATTPGTASSVASPSRPPGAVEANPQLTVQATNNTASPALKPAPSNSPVVPTSP